MKQQFHFFFLGHSVFDTLFFASFTAFFATGFIINCVSGDNNVSAIICLGVLLVAMVFLGVIFCVFDGWAFWRIKENKLLVGKLFRKTKSMNPFDIVFVDEGQMDIVVFATAELLDCYKLFDGKQTICIPKSKAADALIDEIKALCNLTTPTESLPK